MQEVMQQTALRPLAKQQHAIKSAFPVLIHADDKQNVKFIR